MPSFLRRLAVPALLALMLASGAQAAGQGGGSTAVDRALDHVRANAGAAHYDADQTLVVRDVVADGNGAEHVRFDRLYQGLRVLGGDLVVHSDAAGSLAGLSQTLDVRPSVSTSPGLSGEQAARRAAAQFAGRPAGAARAELVVYARSFTPVLAYKAVVEGELPDGSPSELHVIVGAGTGEILDSWDGIENATGTGRGFFNGTVTLETTPISGGYRLTDPTRGNQFTCNMKNRQGSCYSLDDADNSWGDGTLANTQSVAVDAQYGTSVTWDYYKNVHARNGIANDGKGAYNRVHYGRKYNNAYWSDSCFCMTYGDGDGTTYNPFDSLDVAGHEMTHGVTSRTAALTYSGESGGLNEATSDIFGTMVE